VTTATESHTEHTIEVAGLALRYLKGGAGTPVVVLHHSTGNPGWIPFYERLAERTSVYVPDMPGYGQSARAEWAREPNGSYRAHGGSYASESAADLKSWATIAVQIRSAEVGFRCAYPAKPGSPEDAASPDPTMNP
jgi:pimeloyl-ACP methyl ester carboxylesterase